MKKHRIAYIDEDPAEVRKFKRGFDAHFEVIDFAPEEDLDEFVHEILNAHVDAVVSDHNLSEYVVGNSSHVTYDGADLIKKIWETRKDFPCFILTSYDDEAIIRTDDVNSVYPKDYLSTDPPVGKAPLTERIRIQIEHYRKRLATAQKRLKELLEKSSSGLISGQEEDELLKLDSFIESSCCHLNSIPEERKNKIAIGKLEDLLEISKSLLEEVRKEKK